ncbi:MAG: hypothetical protein ACLUTU_16215 [Blautia faecis]
MKIMKFCYHIKNQNLFMGLSVKKLELKGIEIHPTAEEIGEYTGIAPKVRLQMNQ